MADALKVGDVVALKSGGVKMTIESIDDQGYVDCVWFVNAEVQRATFAAATLEKY